MPAVLAMWGGVHGIAAICFDGPLAVLGEPDELDALCERALTVLVRALRRSPRSAPRRGALEGRASGARDGYTVPR